MAKQDEPNKVIYSMVGVGKVYGTKQVLKDIYLGYFYGAKIGVIGLNGSGKSTLLRIMAGVDTEFHRRGRHARPGYTIGYLEQEPKLDPAKTVLEVVKEGAARRPSTCWPSSRRSTRSSPSPWTATRWTSSSTRQGEVQEKLDALDAWDLDSPPRAGHGRPALPARRHPDHRALRRRAAPRRAVPAAAPEARHPAPRRAHQPPRRRDRGVARAAPAEVRGHRHRRHPRPLLPRQRGRLDPRARPRPGHPVEGQLLLLAGAEAGAPAPARRRPRASARRRCSASSSGSACRPRPATPRARRASTPTSSSSPPGPRRSPRTSRSTSRPARASATWSSRPKGLAKGFGDTLLIENVDLLAAARPPSSASSAPTAPARPRCSA